MAVGFYEKAFVCVFIQIILVIFSECCVKKTDKAASPEEMVAKSKYVLYGKVTQKITPDPRTPNVATSYGVKFDIDCIYKGANDEKIKDKEIITIAGAGIVQDDCYTMEVEVNTQYVVFLGTEGSHIVPTYGVPTSIAVQDLGEFAIVCDLIPVGPAGGPLQDECPASDPSDCIRYKFPNVTETSTVKVDKPVPLPSSTAAPTPKPTVKDGTSDKDVVIGSDPKGQEPSGNDNSNTAAIPCLTSVFSIIICIISGMLLS